MKKISVIIPCYNAEYTIDRAMISLERQTIGIENLEIWLLDDNSSDCTGEKILFWCNKYPDSVIGSWSDKRSLPGYLRNYAIDRSDSEYIAFLDADDWIRPDTYELSYNAANDSHVDIVKFLFHVVTSENNTIPDRTGENELILIDECSDKIDTFKHIDYERSCWNKLYKTSFIKENDLRFSEGTYDEESLFTTPAYLNAKRVYLLNDYLYFYYYNNCGATQSMNHSTIHSRDNAKVWMEVYEKCKMDGTLEREYELLEWLFVVNYVYYSILLSKDRGIPYTPDEIEKMHDTAKKLFPNYKNNKALKTLGL